MALLQRVSHQCSGCKGHLFVYVHLILQGLESRPRGPIKFFLSSWDGWLQGSQIWLVCMTDWGYELARKHWLGAQLRRQAQGPEHPPLSVKTHSVEPQLDSAVNTAISTWWGVGWASLSCPQPSHFPLMWWVTEGTSREVFNEFQEWRSLWTKFPKRSSGVLCKSTHERLLRTKRLSWRSATVSVQISLPVAFPTRTGAGVQEVMKQPPAQAPLPTRGNQMGDYHLLHETGNSPPPIRLHLGPSD